MRFDVSQSNIFLYNFDIYFSFRLLYYLAKESFSVRGVIRLERMIKFIIYNCIKYIREILSKLKYYYIEEQIDTRYDAAVAPAALKTVYQHLERLGCIESGMYDGFQIISVL